MTRSPFDLHIIRDFLDAEACRQIVEEMRQSSFAPAPTYGKADTDVDEQVRRVKQALVTQESSAFVTYRLEKQRAAIADHFKVSLTGFEEPQFLCYRAGDFFVAHQDGNTGLVNLETDRSRRVSLSIFLNNQSVESQPETYSGGSLVFSDWRTQSRQEVLGEAGMLVAFRSETTHEVTPVTHGERYVVVSWYLYRDG